MTSADTKARDIAPVKPSSRDPIAQWLDVFTSLLALPAGESERIRDELEDHLRTRVDDLLILGMIEPEAVQKAVTELGETAQLARNFKAVRTHSRRRIAMHTALFAAAGLALTVSVAGFLPQANTAPATSSPAIVDAQPEGEHHNGMLDRDLPEGTLGDMLQMLADAGNARLFVHWGSLEPMGLGPETEIRAIPAKGLEHGKVRQLINSALGLEGTDELTARMDGNLVEIATQAYFDRIETVTMDYDVSELVSAGHVLMVTTDGQNLVMNIETIVEPSVWQNNGGEATLTMSGSLLTVRAPERIQASVVRHIAKLEHIEQERAGRQAMAEKEDRERSINMYKASLANGEETLGRYEEELHEQMRELDAVNTEYWKSQYSKTELEAAYQSAQGEEDRAKSLDALARWGADFDSLDMRRGQLRDAIRETHNNIERTRGVISLSRVQIDAMASASR